MELLMGSEPSKWIHVRNENQQSFLYHSLPCRLNAHQAVLELQQSFLCYPDAKIPVFRGWEWIPVCPHSSRAELKGPAGIPCGAGGWEGQDHCPLTCRDSSCSSCHTPGTGGRRSLAQKQLGCSKESSTGQSQGSPPLPWRLIRSAQNSQKTERGGSSEAKDQIPSRSQLLPPPEPSGMDTGLRHWSKTGVTFQRSKLLQGSTASRNIEYKQTLYLCKYFCKRLELGDTSWRSGAALHKLRNIFWTKMVNLTESMTQRT